MSPVIKLQNLRPEDIFVLLSNIRNVQASASTLGELISDEGIQEYLQDCHKRMGAAFFQTPRDTVKDFVDLIHALEQNPNKSWKDFIKDDSASGSSTPAQNGDDDLAEFRL